jgi:hypothetical protein
LHLHRHPNVLAMEHDYALENWDQLSKDEMRRKTREIVSGELPHAEEVMLKLLSMVGRAS